MKKTFIKKTATAMVAICLLLSIFSTGAFAKSTTRGINTKVITAKNVLGWEICVDYYVDASNSKYYADTFQKRADIARFIWESATYKVPPTSISPIEGMIRIGGATFKLHDSIAQNYADVCYKGSKKSGIIIHTYMNMVTGIDLQ
jgi:hypothetical protein